MEAAGRRALRVNRQRASSRAFELAAHVWGAAAAAYGRLLQPLSKLLKAASGFVRRHPSAGRPQRPPRTELQAAEQAARRQGPAGAKVKRFGLGGILARRESTANCQLGLPNPQCCRPGTPTA